MIIVEFLKPTSAHKKGDRGYFTLRVAKKLRDRGLVKILKNANRR